MKLTTLISCLFLLPVQIFSQDTIQLHNPSFELNAPPCGEIPGFWLNIKDQKLEPSAVQPNCFGVSNPAQEGKRYLALTFQGKNGGARVGQHLAENKFLEQGSRYQITVFLACSKTMVVSKGSKKNKEQVFGNPLALRLIAYNSRLHQEEILSTSALVDHGDWKAYQLVFTIKNGDYDRLDFEAIAPADAGRKYLGNILIDHISPIIRVAKPPGPVFTPGMVIDIENPSFEDEAQCCAAPAGWYSCGVSKEESPPDIQPGSFMVSLPASNGRTYLGMVVRDNGTWEAVGQRLSQALEAGRTYVLQADLARSEQYLSLSRITGQQINLNTPVNLRIWGGQYPCEKTELLAESKTIYQTEWLRHDFILKPSTGNYRYLLLEVYFQQKATFNYNGNLLIDNLVLRTGSRSE